MDRPPFDLVIFDCDGVLIDSEVISARILIEQLGRVGVHVDYAYVQKNFLGRSWTKVAAEVRLTYGLDLDSDFEERYRQDLLAAFETDLRAMEGVSAVIDRLAVPFCAATSSSPKRARRSLELSGLAAKFGERLFTASQVQNGKPAPDLFLFAARSMRVPPEKCLVIEDSLPGILAARAAGMEVWRFSGGGHLKDAPTPSDPVLATVPDFDNWAQFYLMAHGLKKPEHVSA